MLSQDIKHLIVFVRHFYGSNMSTSLNGKELRFDSQTGSLEILGFQQLSETYNTVPSIKPQLSG